VAAWLASAVSSGRLPADATAVESWIARRRRTPGTFICGPEVWGPGHSVS
jgi:hypothetical protein